MCPQKRVSQNMSSRRDDSGSKGNKPLTQAEREDWHMIPVVAPRGSLSRSSNTATRTYPSFVAASRWGHGQDLQSKRTWKQRTGSARQEKVREAGGEPYAERSGRAAAKVPSQTTADTAGKGEGAEDRQCGQRCCSSLTK